MNPQESPNLHWHYITFIVYCTDTSHAIHEMPIACNVRRVTHAVIEKARELAIQTTESAISASVQSISYLGCMTEEQFQDGTDVHQVH